MPDNEVKIKIVIDNAEALARADEVESALRRAQGAGRIGLRGDGGGGGGGGAGGGGALNGLLGAGIGKLAGIAAGIGVGSAMFGSLASDASTFATGRLDWIGRGLSNLMGLQGADADIRATNRAAESTIQALGPAKGVSDSTMYQLLQGYKRLYKPEEDNRVSVENMASQINGAPVINALTKGFESVVDAIYDVGGRR